MASVQQESIPASTDPLAVPPSVGQQARKKLLAPLPVEGWRQALSAILALDIRAVELLPGWLLDPERPAGLEELRRRGIAVVAVTAPAAELMRHDTGDLDVPYRIASPCRPEDLDALHRLAQATGSVVLLPNDPAGWPPDGPALGSAASAPHRPRIAACYDPAAAVARKRHPFLADMMAGPLKRRVRVLRLRDALFSGDEVLPDRGNAELRELVSALEARSYRGWYALAPGGSGPYPARLAVAHAAVAAMLDEL